MRSNGWLAVLVAALVAGGCRRQEIAGSPEGKDGGAVVAKDLPVVRGLLDLEAADHKRAVVIGLYSIEPVRPQIKGGRRVAIVLADGTHVRPYGPGLGSGYALWNKMVTVTGLVTKTPPTTNGGAVQTVGGPHVQVESMGPAEGETPHSPAPSAVPTPTLVTKDTQFDGRDGRWVAVSGTVDALLPTTAPWGTATLLLSDGSRVEIEGVLESEWTPHKGSAVTVVGRVHRGTRVALHGAGPPCAGVVPRCALDDP